MKSWLDPQPITVPAALRKAVGGHPVVAERLARRGITSPEAARRFLDPAAYTPASPGDLPDMDQAVARLGKAVRDREHVLVWGDFDVDGQTSTALLVSALRDLGGKVTYHVPNRFTEGHGIHLPTLKTLLDGGVDLLLTCDTGVAAHEAVSLAHSRLVDVLITDHHALPETLPLAEAVINPMRLPEGHPLRELPGVGTAYQLVRALYGGQSSDHLLDLVAVGIVADVMVLVDDTRYWLQRGLEVLRQSPRSGLKAMLDRAEIAPADLTESDIGFILAPRLNALGRLADANPAVELLTSDDPALIAERVNELEGLNQRRRFLTRQVYEAAQQKIEAEPALLKYAALVVAGEGWHTGVAGIVASRLVEDYSCPVILLSENEGVASGSARSVPGCNIVEAIGSQADMLTSFGGHNMAAGLRLPSDNVFEFRRGVSLFVREALGSVEIQPQLAIDAYLNLSEIDLKFTDDISRLAPFGNGNPPLTLATRNVRVKSRRTLDRRGDHLALKLEDESGNEQRVIWWFGDLDSVPTGTFDLAYTVRPNVYNGKRSAMIEWLDIRPASNGALLIEPTEPAYQVLDYRQHPEPQAMLEQVQERYPDALIWSEGTTVIGGADRYYLREAETLVVWSVPPNPLVWETALNLVQPQTLVLFGNRPPFEHTETLLKRLVGLIKYAHHHKGGIVSRSELAALTGQTEQTISASLKWLNTNTPFNLTAMSEDVYQVDRVNTPESPPIGDSAERLKWLLDETKAYRQYWLAQEF
jgi:single-stranded-DNA-specific exonuclease